MVSRRSGLVCQSSVYSYASWASHTSVSCSRGYMVALFLPRLVQVGNLAATVASLTKTSRFLPWPWPESCT